jgi:hypothetical protein
MTIDTIIRVVGELARPFAIIWIGGACGIAVVRLSSSPDLTEAAVYAGAILGGFAALYLGKSAENVGVRRAEAKIAEATGQTPEQK